MIDLDLVLLDQEHSQVELELRVLEALEIYPLSKLQGLVILSLSLASILFSLYGEMKKMIDRKEGAEVSYLRKQGLGQETQRNDCHFIKK